MKNLAVRFHIVIFDRLADLDSVRRMLDARSPQLLIDEQAVVCDQRQDLKIKPSGLQTFPKGVFALMNEIFSVLLELVYVFEHAAENTNHGEDHRRRRHCNTITNVEAA